MNKWKRRDKIKLTKFICFRKFLSSLSSIFISSIISLKDFCFFFVRAIFHDDCFVLSTSLFGSFVNHLCREIATCILLTLSLSLSHLTQSTSSAGCKFELSGRCEMSREFTETRTLLQLVECNTLIPRESTIQLIETTRCICFLALLFYDASWPNAEIRFFFVNQFLG